MTEAMLATKPKICTILPFKEKSAGLEVDNTLMVLNGVVRSQLKNQRTSTRGEMSLGKKASRRKGLQ